MKITIEVSQTLAQLKGAYIKHLNPKEPKKVKKSDISIWLGSLVESDIDDITEHDKND